MYTVDEARDLYAYVVRHIVPGPVDWSYGVPILLLLSALLIPPWRVSHAQLGRVVLPLIYASQVYYLVYGGGVFDSIYGDLGLRSFALLALHDPRSFTRLVRRRKRSGGEVQSNGHVHDPRDKFVSDEEVWEEVSYPHRWSARLGWVFSLAVSLRHSNWKTGDPSHDETQPFTGENLPAKSWYVRRILRQVVFSYFLLDLASYAASHDPYFRDLTLSIDQEGSLLQHGMGPRFVRTVIISTQLYSVITLLFYLPCLPALLLNSIGLWPDEWSPHTWPPLWGQFSAISHRGLRGLWGEWWHQLMRDLNCSPGRFLLASDPINRWVSGSKTARYAILSTTAFFFSGIMHSGLVPPEPLHSGEPNALGPMKARLAIAGFFWVQPIAFGIEIAAEKLWSLTSSKSVFWQGVRIVWTFCFLSASLPLLAIPFKELGYWDPYTLPISVVSAFAGEGFVKWK